MTFAPIDSLYRLQPRDEQLVPWGPVHRVVSLAATGTILQIGAPGDPVEFVIPLGYHVEITRVRIFADPAIGDTITSMALVIVTPTGFILHSLLNSFTLPAAPLTNEIALIAENVDVVLTHGEHFLRGTFGFAVGIGVGNVQFEYSGIVFPKGNSANFA